MMNFDLKQPCQNCPFRTDIKPYLHPERADEICEILFEGQGTFACHKTVDYSNDSDGRCTEKSQHCAGAMILLEKLNLSNQLMRIAERTHAYDRSALDMNAPVFDTPEEFIMACELADELDDAFFNEALLTPPGCNIIDALEKAEAKDRHSKLADSNS